MTLYYYLGTALPEIKIGEIPEIKFDALNFLLNQNLKAEDLEKVQVVRQFFDLDNIRSYWMGFPLDSLGNLDANALEEALLTKTGLPQFVYDFMDRYDSTQSRLKNFSALFSTFFQVEIARQKGFLQKWLRMERDIRLILLALRAKRLARDLMMELQFENPDDFLVREILASKDADSFTPPTDYLELKALYDLHSIEPLKLHQALLEYRFRKIGESISLQVFTIDRILAYLVQYILVEKWLKLDAKKGRDIINTLVLGVS